MNRKYTTPPFRARRREGTSAFGNLSLCIYLLYASRVLLLLFLPKEPPMSTFRFFFFFFPSSSSSFRGVLLRRVARLLPFPRVDGALHVIVQQSRRRRRRRRIIDSKAQASSSSRRVVVHAAREAEQTRRDENVPGASRPRVERHFSLRRGGCSSSNKSRVLKCRKLSRHPKRRRRRKMRHKNHPA